MLIDATKPGVSLITLDKLANKTAKQNNASCSFYKYSGFPGHICISVNDQLIHGIPTDYVLKENDLITFDVGITYQEHFCDAAFSLVVSPSNNQKANDINEVTKLALDEALKLIKPDNYTGDIGAKIYEVASSHGYDVIRDYSGHGCGNHIHEDPMIFCYGKPHTGIKLRKNMVLCVEPMLMTNTHEYYVDSKNN
ncbi:MAG: type I methionyl aminopeptidase [Mycoplasmoidaceae bacterium]|nr:type I methionyl aminopeptidase [Mycoplasmoidaceae bacterium]